MRALKRRRPPDPFDEEHLPEAGGDAGDLSFKRCRVLRSCVGHEHRDPRVAAFAKEFVSKAKPSGSKVRPFVAGGSLTPPNQEQAAANLGVPIATLRTWLSRLRQRYRESLRSEVSGTVSDPADVDAELRHLYQILMA